jgi:hypothetical protein
MRSVGVQCLLVFATLTACPLALEAQSNLRWLKDAPAGRFTQKDWSLLQTAIRESLDPSSDGTPKSWRNDETGHSGKVTTLKKYTSEGKDCRQLQFDNAADGRTSSTRYKMCQEADGVWREVSSGAPAADFINMP